MVLIKIICRYKLCVFLKTPVMVEWPSDIQWEHTHPTPRQQRDSGTEKSQFFCLIVLPKQGFVLLPICPRDRIAGERIEQRWNRSPKIMKSSMVRFTYFPIMASGKFQILSDFCLGSHKPVLLPPRKTVCKYPLGMSNSIGWACGPCLVSILCGSSVSITMVLGGSVISHTDLLLIQSNSSSTFVSLAY